MIMRATLLLLAVLLATAPAGARADTFEPNDTMEDAYGPLTAGTPLESFIDDADDEDWYWFDAGFGALTVSLTGIPAGADYDLYLWGDEAILAESDNQDNADETISWQVIGGGRFWIQIIGFDDTSDPDDPYTLTAGFTPLNTDPVVELVHPNGGETFTTGAPVTLQWSASDLEDGAALDIALAYSPDDGATWIDIATGLDNTGSHSWTAPAVPTTEGLVRIIATDGDGGLAADVSDGPFAVEPGIAPDLTLTLPDGDVSPGDTLDLPVTFSANVAVGALQFTLAFSPEYAEPVSASAGPRAGGLVMESNLAVPGQARFVFYGTDGTVLDPGAGVVCTVRLLRRDGWASRASSLIEFDGVVAADPQGASLPVTAVGTNFTAVRGVALAAEAAPDGVRLSWTAAADDSHAGFRVLREEAGTPRRLHDGLLAADARAYTDRTAAPGARLRYWLEAVDRAGAVQRFGPVEVFAAAGPLWAGLPYPNPSRGAVSLEVRRAPHGPARAAVVDLAGRVVRELDVPAAGAISWDGRLRDGRVAPAGVYFLHLAQGTHSVTRRIVRLSGP